MVGEAALSPPSESEFCFHKDVGCKSAMALALATTNNPQLTRSYDRIFEDAHISGELKLSGKKLKDFPKISPKYNLGDTVRADLSKNKFTELPCEVCEFYLLEQLDCYHNVVRSIPESVITLQSLTYLNFSRNQLSTIPLALCQLPLQVLILSNNKLVSLPEEIGHLQNLMELDVSCNEITILPQQIGDLVSLRSLNIHRNQLVELRPEVCELRLVKLDISGNRISVLPPALRFMTCLQDLQLEHNPLTSPPAFLCTRGRVHIFKYLEIQAIKEDKKRGAILDSEFRWSGRKPAGLANDLRIQNGFANDNRRKRYTVDSGYNTSDGSDKRWSQDLQELNSDLEDARKLALRAAEVTKEQRHERDLQLLQRRASNATDSSSSTLTRSTITPTPSRQDIRDSQSSQDDCNDKEHLQRLREERRSISAGRPKEDPTRSPDLRLSRSSSRSSSCGPPADAISQHSQSSQSSLDAKRKNFHPETYKEFKESRRQLRTGENGTIYGRRPSNGSNGSTPGSGQSSPSRELGRSSESPSPQSNHVTPEEEFKAKHEAIKNSQNQRTEVVGQTQKRIQESFSIAQQRSATPVAPQPQPRVVIPKFPPSNPKTQHSPPNPAQQQSFEHHQRHNQSKSPPTNNPATNGHHYNNANASPQQQSQNWRVPSIAHNGTSHKVSPPILSTPQNNTANIVASLVQGRNPTFTIRRELDKAREEKELVERLKKIIESRLKFTLPDDLASSLMDGVVLCHLANNVRPMSVATIHVPSPDVPKLTIAKCRRNVDNFLDACRRIGVSEALLCHRDDVVVGQFLTKTAVTVLALTEAAKFVEGKYSPGVSIQPPPTTTTKPSLNGANASPQRPTELKLRSSYPEPENQPFINDMELLCNAQDILEERGLAQLSITVQEMIKFGSQKAGRIIA